MRYNAQHFEHDTAADCIITGTYVHTSAVLGHFNGCIINANFLFVHFSYCVMMTAVCVITQCKI